MEKQITKAIDGKMYSFKARYHDREEAKEAAKKLVGAKHVYYTKVTEKGKQYFDVRTEN